ncbi:excisionase family DNA-binding protein [bacterium]|nr:excisionase family DNA-binding protein [bacterium]
MEDNSPIMNLEEIARYLKIGKSTRYKMLRESKIPAVKTESGRNIFTEKKVIASILQFGYEQR